MTSTTTFNRLNIRDGHTLRTERANLETRESEKSRNASIPIPRTIRLSDNVSVIYPKHLKSKNLHRQYNKLSGNVFRWKFATKDYGIVLVTSTKYVKGDKRLRSSKVLKQDVKQFKYKVRLGTWKTKNISNKKTIDNSASLSANLRTNPRAYGDRPKTQSNLNDAIKAASASHDKCLQEPVVPMNATVYEPITTLDAIIKRAPHAVGCTCIDWASRAFGTDLKNHHAAKGCKHMLFVDTEMRLTHLGSMEKPGRTAEQRAYFLWDEWVNRKWNLKYNYPDENI